MNTNPGTLTEPGGCGKSTTLAESATEPTTRGVHVRGPDDAGVVFDRQDEQDIVEAEVS